jgi:SagB-type dehydrogenase family enzyme
MDTPLTLTPVSPGAGGKTRSVWDEAGMREIGEVLAALPPKARAAVAEVAASAADAARIGSSDPSLAHVLQRVFVRSVAEFFSAQRQSTRMPDEQVRHILPDPEATNLPAPEEELPTALSEVLLRRRSVRNFASRPFPLEELSTLLHHTAGRRGVEAGYGIRDVPLFRYPSIGGLNSVEVRVIVNRVAGLEPGHYVYDPVGHALRLVSRGDMRLSLQDVTFEAEWLFHAPVVIVLAHDQTKVSWKYKTRGYRFSHVDLGAVMQNVYLVATAMELSCCAAAGFFDEGLNDLLGLDGIERFASLVMGVGPMGTVTFEPAD